MTPKEIATKTEKVITMHRDDSIFNKYYFNPKYLSELYKLVPELKDGGIKIQITETETPDATLIHSSIIKDSHKLDLGTIKLDGETASVVKKLSTVDSFTKFIENVLGKEEEPDDQSSGDQGDRGDVGEDEDTSNVSQGPKGMGFYS